VTSTTSDLEREIKFWYQFDDFFNPRFQHVPADVLSAYNYEPRLLESWTKNRISGTYPQGFIDTFKNDQKFVDAIKLLAKHQTTIMDDNFHGDRGIERKAFEDFAQGILYDQNRIDTQKIHMMNEGFGYQRWHAFIRAAVFVGEDTERWLGIDRNVGMAWAIQSKLTPHQDKQGENPNNPARTDVVDQLRPVWPSRSFEEIDNAFDAEELRKLFAP